MHRIIATATCLCTAFSAALSAPDGTVGTRICPPRKRIDADDHATMRTRKSLQPRYAIDLHGDVPDERLTGIIKHVCAEAAR